MDPVTILGAVGSVVGIASFGLQLAKFLDEFIDEFSSADEKLHAIFHGIQATNNALTQVEGLLREERRNILDRGKPVLFSTKALDDVQETADQCLTIFWRIEATILRKDGAKDLELQILRRLARFYKEVRNSRNLDEPASMLTLDARTKLKSSKIQQFMFAFSTKTKLENYNQQLYRHQTSLILVFQVVHLRFNLTKPKQHWDNLLELPQSYRSIRTMATELGMVAGETSRRSHRSAFNPGLDIRRPYRESEMFVRSNSRNRPSTGRGDTFDSLRREPRGFRHNRHDAPVEREHPSRGNMHDVEREFEDIRHMRTRNPYRSFSRATRQESEISATPETKQVARHLQKAESYMATDGGAQKEVPPGKGPGIESNSFGDFPYSVSPTPLEQDELHSMLPEHGSTSDSEFRELYDPNRSDSFVTPTKKPNVYQKPSVTDQTLTDEDSEDQNRQSSKARVTDVQFDLNPTDSQPENTTPTRNPRHGQAQTKVGKSIPRPILKKGRPSVDRSQRQATDETISLPSPLFEGNEDNRKSSNYQENNYANQIEQFHTTQERDTSSGNNNGIVALSKPVVEWQPNGTTGPVTIPGTSQRTNGETRNLEKRIQGHLLEQNTANGTVSRQRINPNAQVSSDNLRAPPIPGLNSTVEQGAATSRMDPTHTEREPSSRLKPLNERPKNSQPTTVKADDLQVLHVAHPIERMAGLNTRTISSARPTSQAIAIGLNDPSNGEQTMSNMSFKTGTNSIVSHTPSRTGKRETVLNALKRITRRDFMSQEDLENMFGTGALVTAFVIRGPQYHQIPCAGHFSMRKADMANLRSSGSISWKEFAFLDPDEVSTLSLILDTGDGYAKALVQLKWLRKESGMKFWSSADRALIAIIYNEKIEAQSDSTAQLDKRDRTNSSAKDVHSISNPKALLPPNLKWAPISKPSQAASNVKGKSSSAFKGIGNSKKPFLESP